MLAWMHSLKKGAALKSLWAVFTLLCSHITQGSHLSLCWHSLSAKLFRCSCVLLFSQDGWGTPFTWAESGPDDSAIAWVSRFTHSHGPHYHTQELHILIEECVKCTICSTLGKRGGFLSKEWPSWLKPSAHFLSLCVCLCVFSTTEWHCIIFFSLWGGRAGQQ